MVYTKSFQSGLGLAVLCLCNTLLAAEPPSGLGIEPAGQNFIRNDQQRLLEEQQRKLRQLQRLPGSQMERPAEPGQAEARCFPVAKIALEGVTLFDQATRQALVEPFDGRCLSASDLNELLRAITQAYVDRGFVTTRAYLPQQNLSRQRLRVVIAEGRIEAIESQAASPTPRELAMASPVEVGDLLNLRDLEQLTDQLNRLPSNQATIRIAARSGIDVLYAGRDDETIDQAIDRAVDSNPELAWLRGLQGRDDVTWKALEEVHDAWSYSRSGLSPLAANILAAATAYYTAGAASGLIGSMAGASAGSGTAMAAASGNAVAGWANASLSGMADGAVGGAAGAASQGYDWKEPALNGAITGGLANYMAGGTYFNNNIHGVEKIGRDLAAGAWSSLSKTVYRQGMNRFFGKVQSEFAEEIGLTSEQLNWVLMSGSIAGASLDSVGTRFKFDDQDFILSGEIGDRGVSDRGFAGLPFDAIDILLGYQGLPDSSVQAQLTSQGLGGVSTGHSLGTLTNIYLTEYGLIDEAYLFSVPLGIVAPSNTTVTDGTFDMVNGGWAGKLFNWDAIMVPLMPWEHGYNEHYKRFIEANPGLYQ